LLVHYGPGGQFIRKRFGEHLAIDGRRALLGAPWDNDGPPFGAGHNAGSTYVFELDSNGAPARVLGALGADGVLLNEAIESFQK
jgi:hypothetical protein